MGLALVGCAVATYLSLYQWGITSSIWDPLFGRESQVIVTSPVSGALPIPDATLGALAYLADALLALVGDENRWRTLPWVVLLQGLVVLGLVVTALTLIGVQLLVFHAGCTLCLLSAAASLGSGWLAHGEILACLRYLEQARARGQPFWPTLWG